MLEVGLDRSCDDRRVAGATSTCHTLTTQFTRPTRSLIKTHATSHIPSAAVECHEEVHKISRTYSTATRGPSARADTNLFSMAASLPSFSLPSLCSFLSPLVIPSPFHVPSLPRNGPLFISTCIPSGRLGLSWRAVI